MPGNMKHQKSASDIAISITKTVQASFVAFTDSLNNLAGTRKSKFGDKSGDFRGQKQERTKD